MSDEYVPHQAPPAATPPTPSSSESVTPSKPSAASEFFRGIRTGLPVLSGCLPLGFILGVEAGRKGMTPLSIWMMTSINYAGGSEFAAVALWSAAPPMLVVWLTTWLINSRHIVMGASLSLYARHLPAKTNAFIYFLMCDEVWAIGSADIKRRSELGLPAHELLSLPFYVAVGLMFWSCWALSAAAGAWLGSDLGDLSHWGVQMAFPATFLSLLAMMWPGVRKCHPIVISAVAAAVTSLVLPPHWCVLLATLCGLAWVWFTTPEKAQAQAETEAEREAEREADAALIAELEKNNGTKDQNQEAAR